MQNLLTYQPNATATEVQRLTFDPGVNGGSFTITYGTNLTSGSINWSNNAADSRRAIQTGLDGSSPPATVVPSASGSVFTITFASGLANANLQQITTTSLAHGRFGDPVYIRDGVGDEVETLTLGGTSTGTFSPSHSAASPPPRPSPLRPGPRPRPPRCWPT